MYLQLEGGFGSMRAILTMLGLGAKMGRKLKEMRCSLWLSFLHHSIRLHMFDVDLFGVVGY